MLATASFTPAAQHQVQAGETLSLIASRNGLSVSTILEKNPQLNPDRLQIGDVIIIPAQMRDLEAPSASSATPAAGTYTVRNGDNFWTIARRHGISVEQLSALNGGIDGERLQIGDVIRVPGAGSATAAPAMTLANNAAPAPVVANSPIYNVQAGENDWIIARRFGISPSELHAANPGINWRRLQIGQELVIPGVKSDDPASMLMTQKRLALRSVASRFIINESHVQVAVDSAIVRSGARQDRPAIVSVPQGTVAAVRDRIGAWYKLEFPRGTIGWVRGDLIEGIPASVYAAAMPRPAGAASGTTGNRSVRVASNAGRTSASAPRISVSGHAGPLLATAQNYLGVRYRFGGTSSRSGFDCSGFVLTVFRQHGVSLPRTSASQATVGQAVSRGNLSPGDLVFFRTGRGSRISHVGIYMGGNRFIHASSGGGNVRIDSLGSAYYNSRYAGARRVLRGGQAVAATAQQSASSTAASTSSTASGSSAANTTASGNTETVAESVPPLEPAPATQVRPGADALTG